MRTLLFTIFLGFHTLIYSQIQFNHSAGVAFGVFVQSNYLNFAPLLEYNPRLDYVFHAEVSVSLTTHLGIGRHYNLPLMVQLNLGNHASKESEFPVGIYAAAGFTRFGLWYDYHIVKPCLSFGIKVQKNDRKSITFKMDFIPNEHTFVGGIPYTQFKYSDIFIFGFLRNF